VLISKWQKEFNLMSYSVAINDQRRAMYMIGRMKDLFRIEPFEALPREGFNVVVTGKSGAGKSVMVNELINKEKDCG
jgi:tRNA U34 5-carboxymethylaminomethyl modifying GTPase MnmE/TrmE